MIPGAPRAERTPAATSGGAVGQGSRLETSKSAAAWWPLLALLAAVGIFQLLTIRAGHDWGDDFALYILHARALLEGRAYGDTGFIYSDANRWYSPAVYPPGFPLLLLPVYALFGLNFIAMKVLVVAFFIGSLGLFASLVRPQLPGPYLLLLVALLGFQPYLTEFKNQILPDFPFLCFALASLLLLRPLEDWPLSRRGAIAWAVGAGVLMYCAIAIRVLGVALIAGVFLSLLVRRRKPTATVLIAVVISLLLWAAQRLLLPAAGAYSAQFTGFAAQVTGQSGASGLRHFIPDPGKVWTFAAHTVDFWGGLGTGVSYVITLAVLAIGAIGLISRIPRLSALDGFFLAYCGILFLYPVPLDTRYLVPVLPLLFLYAAVGASLMIRSLGRMAAGGAVVLTVLVGTASISQLVRADYGRIRGSGSTAAVQLYDAVKACARPADRIMFAKIRAMILFTGRPGLVTPRRNVDLWRFLSDGDIRFVAVRRADWLDSLARQAGDRLRPIFANNTFVLYRNEALSPAPGAGPLPCRVSPPPG